MEVFDILLILFARTDERGGESRITVRLHEADRLQSKCPLQRHPMFPNN